MRARNSYRKINQQNVNNNTLEHCKQGKANLKQVTKTDEGSVEASNIEL